MSVDGVGELALLQSIKPYLGAGAGRDDAAIIPDGDGFLVASTDMFVEGVHFDLGWMTAEDAGWRSLALALGDLAAKGAQPGWALAALAVPKGWTVEQVSGLYSGMHALAGRWQMPIAGGDMSAIDGPAVLSLTVAGRTSKRPLGRWEARPGWAIAVTGPLGAAAVALRGRRAHRVEPLIESGRRLNELGLCCGDISDGLVREMEKFAAMSGAGSIIQADLVARAAGASLEDALTSGEEAELVCVGPRDMVLGAGLSIVGETIPDRAVKLVGASLQSTGYDHFGRAAQ